VFTHATVVNMTQATAFTLTRPAEATGIRQSRCDSV